MTILLVDDKQENLYLLEKMLQGNGYETLSAANGAEALTVALKNPPDMIVSDILMPVMDGFSLCREWRKNNTLKKIPFIFYTATYTDPKDEEFALKLGADRFIVKPLEVHRFLQIIQETIGTRTSHEGKSKPGHVPEDKIFLKEYNETLVRRLEQKMMRIEAAEKELRKKNAALEKDIDERKRAEEALENERSLLRTLIDNLPNLVYIKDTESRFLLGNRAVARHMGAGSPDELIGKTDRDFYPGEKAAQFLADEQVVLQTGNALMNHDEPNTDAEGNLRWIVSTKLPLRDSHGRIIGLIGISHDITERKRSERALVETEAKFRTIFDFASDGILLAGVDDRKFSTVNRKICMMLGYTEEELIKLNVSNIHPEESLPYVLDQFDKLKRKEILIAHSIPVLRKNGTIFFADISSSQITLDGKEYLLGVFRDITERKRIEENQRESIQLFQGLFNASPDAIVLIDPHHQNTSWPIVDCNEAACKMNGYSHEELVGKSIDVLNTTAGTPEERTAYLENIRREGIIHLVSVHRHKDGHIFPVEISTSIVTLGGREMVLGIDRDITERTNVEKALRESKALYQSFVEHLPAGVFRKDLEGRYIFVNSYFCRLKGLTSDEILGKTPKELSAYEQTKELSRNSETMGFQRTIADQGMDHHQLIIHTGKPIELEEMYPQPDGTIKYFQVVKSPVFSSDGKIIGTQGVQFDITEHKIAEEARHASEKLFQDLFNASPDANMLIDPDNQSISWPIMDCNEAACRMNGFTREELLGHSIDILNPEKGSPEERSIFMKNLREKRTVYSEIFHRHKDGHLFPIEVSTTIITLEGREMILGIDRDITERKRAEVELKESEERYRRLVEFSPDAIAVHSEGKIVYVNPAAISLLGAQNASELIGKPFLDIIHPEYREIIHEQIIAVIKEDYAIPVTEQKFIRLDGSCVDVEVAALPIVYKQKSAMQIVVRDISEQKKLQSQLLQTQKIQSIGTLAGGIAHDFNNILGIILAYSSLVEKGNLTPEKFAVSINAINQAVQRGAALVRQILTFARKTDVVFEPLDIPDMIHELFSMLAQTFPRTITFSETIADTLPFIFADRTQVHQALLNLCINARDAMPNGGSISVAAETLSNEQMTLQFPAADAETYVCLTVTDTGHGMDEATRLRIFDPFFTTKEKGKGTGLGLSVVYGVVQAHHGFLDLKSEPGRGTSFRLFFPVPKNNDQTVDSQQPAEAFETGGTETILIVEDEELLIQMVSFLLESKGYTVLCARDGLEAVQVYQSHKEDIALVLTDMGLPVMTGKDEFKKLKEINPNVKIIFASGYFEPDTKSELLKDGAQGFIQKPYEPNDILRIVRQALD